MKYKVIVELPLEIETNDDGEDVVKDIVAKNQPYVNCECASVYHGCYSIKVSGDAKITSIKEQT
jgi:hypothetical protein